jgi:hypothetical protein
MGGMDLLKIKASDYDLHGPVRQCIERTTYPQSGDLSERSFTTTYTYSVEGRLLEKRVGTIAGTDCVRTYTYDAAGRVVKVSSGNEDPTATTKFDTTYTYDKGGLVSVTSSSGTQQIGVERGEEGRKRRVEHFPVRPSVAHDVGLGAISWENSELQFPPPFGGTIITIYDEQNRPVEGQAREVNGELTVRIVRTYDEQGHIRSDRLTPGDLQSKAPEELAGKMNDAQKKAIGGFIANAFYTGEATYKYDAAGRLVEKHRSGGVLGDTLTSIAYNDHGDVSDEIAISTVAAEFSGREFQIDESGNAVPVSQPDAPERKRAETHYTYEYDAGGNWIKKTVSVRADSGDPKTSLIIERTLTYY